MIIQQSNGFLIAESAFFPEQFDVFNRVGIHLMLSFPAVSCGNGIITQFFPVVLKRRQKEYENQIKRRFMPCQIVPE